MKKGDERIGDFFEQAPIGMFRTRMDNTGIQEVNQTMLDLLEYRREELLQGKPVVRFVKPEEREALSRQLEKNGIVRDYETSFYTKSGRIVNVVLYSRLLDDKNTVECYFLDITDRKRIESELRKNEENFRNLFENSPLGKSMTRMEGSMHVNRAFCEMVGYTENEMIKMTWRDVTLPEDVDLTDRMIQKLMSGEEEVIRFEKRLMHKNGSLIWAEITSYLERKSDGTPDFLVTTINDITQRKAIEETLRQREKLLISILESTGTGILVVGNDGMVSHVNQLFADIWEMPEHLLAERKDDRMIAWAMTRLEDPDGFSMKVRELNHTDRISIDTLRLKDGRILERISYPLLMVGQISGRVWGFRDVTLLQRAEDDIRKANAELKELNATKDKFFSIIAHDLKNPFNSIIGFSELLQENAHDLDFTTISQYASIMNSSARHASELLENLLVWARIQQGSLSFHPSRILLRDTFDSEWLVLKNNALQKKLQVTIRIPDDLFIEADGNMIGTCFRNLVANAIKFTPRGGKIQVTARVIGDRTEIAVKDSGVGIDPASLEKLFRIETSFSTRGTDNEKGTGLGLLLVKEFVQMHNGTIRVTSELGSGSTFIIRIPLVNPGSDGQ